METKVEVKVNVEEGTVELQIFAPEEVIMELVEEIEEAQKRGEVIVEKMEIK